MPEQASCKQKKEQSDRKKQKKRAGPEEKTEETNQPFEGDRTLAQAIHFMSDSLVAREFAYAVTDGNTEWVYKHLKVIVFSFAGSLHTNPKLRDAILKNWLVNLKGMPESFCGAGDLLQEHYNLLLQEFLVHIDILWDAQMKKDMLTSLGLAHRTNKEPEPHNNPKIETLLQTYCETELHFLWQQRDYGECEVCNFERGIKKLAHGRLKKWIDKTTKSCGLMVGIQKVHNGGDRNRMEAQTAPTEEQWSSKSDAESEIEEEHEFLQDLPNLDYADDEEDEHTAVLQINKLGSDGEDVGDEDTDIDDKGN
ncbi:hypothetical protein SERLA73DRAFT_154419 [Serpula lacrymans var. lacrymans S7.3]|uniref:DUF6589 domain-containing protein n=2 Tax=Serpula lacrymans var. lacrymans TaxID=341189 RepID=F8Q5N7_SERL3|nr:uncharacterized protein SERLADRAFT_412091 [Serpula lacrymans var. lacrymans S7.9]EGN95925.1 hypothetical protein SERLA73DRAFT_154419 [Serpula lacrymans var. lacrymans S7.3]EGO18531.1 hypothetical protein SERLADRAFT_412091 [Serpula lacrymans var. lacrymans S7.9]